MKLQNYESKIYDEQKKEGISNLVGFFEVLIDIDKAQLRKTKKTKSF